jgi:NTE family protein
MRLMRHFCNHFLAGFQALNAIRITKLAGLRLICNNCTRNRARHTSIAAPNQSNVDRLIYSSWGFRFAPSSQHNQSMSLDTILTSGLSQVTRPTTALVLMGGGARTAYQAGVLRALASILKLQPEAPKTFPFQLLVGTSAGAINAAGLAVWANNGLRAFEQLAQFWGQLRSADVYRLNVAPWVRFNRYAAAWSLARHARANGAILDTMPMVDSLHRHISLNGIDEALRSQAILGLAVTGSSYSSGVHWTFCQTAKDAPFEGWTRPGRRAEFTNITIEHLMASSAIPFLFPATPLWVDGHREFFGDGAMRQMSPLSPAMHLGARKILVVGVGQPDRPAQGTSSASALRGNTLGSIFAHTMASVFHDTLQADVEQTRRVNQTLRQLPRDASQAMPYRAVEVMAISPTQSLDDVALKHINELPTATRHALSGLGILKGGGGVLASYLLFEPGFVQTLIAMGESDAYARKAEFLEFFGSR